MSRLPEKTEILKWIRENPHATGKREIARAFGLKGAARVELKALLREMKQDGLIARDRKRHRDPTELPPVAVLVVAAPDADGDLFAVPQNWDGTSEMPRIHLKTRGSDPALAAGDRVLARVQRVNDEPDHSHTAQLIRRIGSGPQTVLGVFSSGREGKGGLVRPVDKKSDGDMIVPAGETGGARDGELVEAERLEGRRGDARRVRILLRLGDPAAARSVSLIAIHQHGIDTEFSPEALKQADSSKPVTLGSRTDLRDLPLITIDPPDARDRDDAVCAMPDDDPSNPDGWVVWVAIADVAHYVPSGTPLDREARRRGNSTYFPDRVVPMLPESLSAGLCSLHDDVDRACLAVRIVLDAKGVKRGHRFERGLMRSRAALSYAQAQAVDDGIDGHGLESLAQHIQWLFAAYRCAEQARARRAPLHLDLPERRIELTDDGVVRSVTFRDRFAAHKMIEEFMIAANVAAAQTLERRRRPVVYRVHEEPDAAKLDALREVAESCGLIFPKGQVLKTAHFNTLLDAAAGTDFAELINMTVLRSQTQAYYAVENFGHFGLNLGKYAHFTSPIRRYADLLVHRSLIDAHGWGDDGLTPEETDNLEATATHISQTERLSMLAERDTNDRYLASYLSEQVGNSFTGRVSGVASFGVFVKLEETGADGLIPVSTLGREYFRFDRDAQTLTGETTGQVVAIGLRATVRLAEAVPVTGGLLFELLELEGKRINRPGPGRGRPGRPKGIRNRVKSRRPKRQRS